MLKGIYELLTGPLGPLGLPIKPLYEWLIMLVVVMIAHKVAWHESPGGRWGSLAYWVTKIAAVLVIWAILRGIIAAYRFLTTHWQAALLLAGITAWFVLVIGYEMIRKDKSNV